MTSLVWKGFELLFVENGEFWSKFFMWHLQYYCSMKSSVLKLGVAKFKEIGMLQKFCMPENFFLW